MITVYGIKTCGSVRNALKFFKDHNIEVDFFDFKQKSPTASQIKDWTKKVDINILFNSKGTKYKTLNLKELNLDDQGKYEWLCKDPLLFKRPVIEFDDKLVVAWDEEEYKKTFL
ncbi:arsenate reductase family protein [Aliarcobacter butzleri]|uniref:arsenate reductase family protein n=1 Tax=Aliarcobacter butzleri TaxID=28197 RepID=UPI00125FE4A1|nr:arsenate reductase family protein [Aliarcobacter butzleri]MCT7572134.1 arsenate reductase family protein [Aliarcobacter butzleri]MCT7573736.1 arsenate reductase family protein [Aliarcobacter butzleri]MCT7592946.1 arsenate reductase family protein [Aliarcobacter butzleri]MDK2064683.1 arsenate reductase family protein [Aliarcobacter butzleri]